MIRQWYGCSRRFHTLLRPILPLQLTEQFFDFGLKDRPVKELSCFGRAHIAELMHPEIRCWRLTVPLGSCTVQEIDIPRLPWCAQHFLPSLAGEPVSVPIVAQPIVTKFIRAAFRPAP